jgi:hypothetical protein
MKEAISVSLGSSVRDKRVEIELDGAPVILERRGADGDAQRAAALFSALDGQVDALGVGGIDLWLTVNGRRYPLHAGHRLVAGVRQTPVVDGSGLKESLEYGCADALAPLLGGRRVRVLVTSAVDRYGMARSFVDAGHEVIFGDLMFGFGLPLPMRRLKTLHALAHLLMPVVGRLPFALLYPTGERQGEIRPRFERWYQWADVIAGDFHYIHRHMPDDLEGKLVVTNTTTPADLEAFRQRGVRAALTTTPSFAGRTFGTNLLEAGITAVAGLGRPLRVEELRQWLRRLALQPALHELSDARAPLRAA